jgi:tetratricopeptide (TPR) repeat protein
MAEKRSSNKKLTARQTRDLDVTIGFLEGIVRRDPAYVEALQLLGDDYTRSGRYESGLEVDERLAKLRPDDPLVHYNLACSYSLTKQLTMAAAALHRAIDLGYVDTKWILRDPDLKNLREHVLFEDIRPRLPKKTKTED